MLQRAGVASVLASELVAVFLLVILPWGLPWTLPRTLPWVQPWNVPRQMVISRRSAAYRGMPRKSRYINVYPWEIRLDLQRSSGSQPRALSLGLGREETLRGLTGEPLHFEDRGGWWWVPFMFNPNAKQAVHTYMSDAGISPRQKELRVCAVWGVGRLLPPPGYACVTGRTGVSALAETVATRSTEETIACAGLRNREGPDSKEIKMKAV